MSSSLRLIATWLAAFSLLIDGLMPLAAYAAAPAQAAMPICSASPHAKSNTDGPAAGYCCGHCCTGGHMPALPGRSGFPAPHDAWAIERAPMHVAAVRVHASPSHAQPRAPPVFSDSLVTA